MIRKFINTLILVLFFFPFAVMADKKITIPVLQIVEHPALDATRRGVLDELIANGYEENKNLNWIYESAQGNTTLALQIAQKFVSMKPDVIVAIPTPAAQSLVNVTKKNRIPVVFSSVTDPIAAKLVTSLSHPGANITGASNFVDVVPQLELFKELVPNLKNLGVIYSPGEANSVKMVKLLENAGKGLGINIVSATANKTIDVPQAATSLIGKVDAIFISNDNTALSALKSIVRVTNQAKIPTFTSDIDIIEQGALAVLGPNQYQLGRQTGKLVVEILNGKNPGDMPVVFPEKMELHLNLDAANAIGYKFSDSVINKADEIHKNSN